MEMAISLHFGHNTHSFFPARLPHAARAATPAGARSITGGQPAHGNPFPAGVPKASGAELGSASLPGAFALFAHRKESVSPRGREGKKVLVRKE